MDGRSEFNSTFRGLCSFSCLRLWLRSGATCSVTVALTATTMAVEPPRDVPSCPVSRGGVGWFPVPDVPVTPVPPPVGGTQSVTSTRTCTERNAPSAPVPQGRSTVSAVVFQVASVGAGELNVLAPLALRARTRLKERQLVFRVTQARTRLQERPLASPAIVYRYRHRLD